MQFYLKYKKIKNIKKIWTLEGIAKPITSYKSVHKNK